MKRFFLAAIAALLCAAPATAQTIKTLGYNTTNGVIVAGTNALSFTNSVSFATLAFTNITASNITLNGVLSFTNGPTNQLQQTRSNLLTSYSGNA
jgi:opacity protein-like surface antigen